jgi:uncharacterized membrane protein HdeD (DUF308 family)
VDTLQTNMAALLQRNWWVLLLRGIAAIAFGLLAWFEPGVTLAVLVLLFGAYSLVDGALGVWSALAARKEHDDWWLLLLVGLLGVGVGILTFVAPGLTAIGLLFYIAVWAIATGVLEIITAIRLRKQIEGEWLLVLGGVVSVLFGVLLMAQPGAGALAVLWLIGGYAVVFGILLVVLALKARRFGGTLAPA